MECSGKEKDKKEYTAFLKKKTRPGFTGLNSLTGPMAPKDLKKSTLTSNK